MRRRLSHSKLLAPVALLLVCALTGGLLWHDLGAAQATPKSPPAHAAAARHSVLFGISDPELINESASVQAAQLKRMRSIGIDSIRFDANWNWVQFAGPKSFDWTQLDREIHSSRAAGMTVDLQIDGCPPWAGAPADHGGHCALPASPLRFGTWAQEVAERYAPDGVHDFEIWNEPNLGVWWHHAVSSPAFYTKMLKAAYTDIKKVDPGAFIISGGLAPTTTHGDSLSITDFLNGMYKAGAKPYFNAVGVHPYCYPSVPDDYESWSAWSQMSQTTPSVLSVMRRYGDSKKQLWLTEFGVRSNRPGGAEVQAASMTQAIAIAKSEPWIGSLYIYTWQDVGGHKNNPYGFGFGIIANDGKPKPAYTALQAAIAAKG
ncbi:MAG TPA: cellulase family glycosylhydrolase [Acidimicrobiales bacterium]|jgi:hypothetical protein|nr:cellulase family glycosylhydrolase [Acidimicrobiales bacterium]